LPELLHIGLNFLFLIRELLRRAHRIVQIATRPTVLLLIE